MKKWISILCALALSVGLTACSSSVSSGDGSSGGSDGGKTKITVMRAGDQEKVESFMEPAIAKFMENNPDIEVEIVYEGWGNLIQTYPTMFENNTQPDVIFWWDNKQNDSSVKDKLVPLNDIVDQEVFDKIPQNVWDISSLEGEEIYYVPSSVDAYVMMYNKDVFRAAGLDPDQPPTTWDELLKACEAITANTDVPALGIPAKTGMETLQEFFALFITQNTRMDMVDENNQVTFNNAEGLEAIEFIGKLIPHLIPSTTDYARGELRPLIRDGQLGIVFDSAWAIPNYTEKYGDNLDDSPIGIAEVPLSPNGEKITWAGTNGWVATREETAEASGRLISWLMSDEMLYEHHKAYGSIPIVDYELKQDFYSYEYWKTMSDVLYDYKMIGMIGKYHSTPAAFYSELEPVQQLYLNGNLDAQQTLDAMAEAVDKINARQE